MNSDSSAYLFRLRDISQTGMGVLVKEDSDLLNQIRIGDAIDVKYNPVGRSDSPQFFKTEIRHISKAADGPYKGSTLLGLSIIEDEIERP
jgi:c-di-GMP-binding flagellar brake protein YcgR